MKREESDRRESSISLFTAPHHDVTTKSCIIGGIFISNNKWINSIMSILHKSLVLSIQTFRGKMLWKVKKYKIVRTDVNVENVVQNLHNYHQSCYTILSCITRKTHERHNIWRFLLNLTRAAARWMGNLKIDRWNTTNKLFPLVRFTFVTTGSRAWWRHLPQHWSFWFCIK